MDLNEIQDLIEFVSKTGISEVELETKDFKIIIKSGTNEQVAPVSSVPVIVHAPAQIPVIPQQQVVEAAPAAAPAPKAETPPATEADDESKYVTVKSPMIGTFYRSSSPDKPPFIGVGEVIEPGKVICIIEAMKLFNEIEAEVSGKIVKVLVDDASPVEYDTPLFLLDPS